MKEYIDQLLKGFDGDYLDFCKYVYKVLEDPKYKRMQLGIFQYIANNEKAISKQLKKSK